jgi:hypothetical protein
MERTTQGKGLITYRPESLLKENDPLLDIFRDYLS